MLELGADPNFFGYDGSNALIYTAYSHNPTLMKFLLENGVNPNVIYSPEDGFYVKSDPYDIISTDCMIDDDNSENLLECKNLLENAGAVL